MRVLTWNVFHGRDAPPDAALHTLRSRLLRITERDATHAQVNRPLREQFFGVIAKAEWDVLLLQELPPRWIGPLAARCGAEAASVLTSRNSLGALRGLLADLNPDLIGANEGGSNAILARAPWRIAERRELTVARRPERRRMVWALLHSAHERLAVANVHLSTVPAAAAREAEGAAIAAIDWAAGAPLLFGGDLNVRPADSPEVFAALAARHAVAPPTPGRAIDHLMVRDATIVEPPAPLPPEWREVPEPAPPHGAPSRRVRLSDHDAVGALIALDRAER